MDNWADQSTFACHTCRFYVPKSLPPAIATPTVPGESGEPVPVPGLHQRTPILPDEFTFQITPAQVGRCRRHAPVVGEGWPVVYPSDWCGDHKIARLPQRHDSSETANVLAGR